MFILVPSNATLIDPFIDVIEDNSYNYECDVFGGTPSAVHIDWFINGILFQSCSPQPLDGSCIVFMNILLDGMSLRCQPFQLDYKTGGYDEIVLNVICEYKY